MTQGHSAKKRYTPPVMLKPPTPAQPELERVTVPELVQLVQADDGGEWTLTVNGNVAAHGPAESFGWIELVCVTAGMATRAGVRPDDVMREILGRRAADAALRATQEAEGPIAEQAAEG
jgi:hypothetical protein